MPHTSITTTSTTMASTPKKPYLLLIVIIAAYALIKSILQTDTVDQPIAGIESIYGDGEKIARSLTINRDYFDPKNSDSDRFGDGISDLRSGSRNDRGHNSHNSYNNDPHNRNQTKNHTLLKANVKDVIHILNNLKKIDIDPRQMQIYNKYKEKQQQRQRQRDNDTDSAAAIPTDQFSPSPSLINHPFGDEKLDPMEIDRLLREREDVVHPHPFRYLINSPDICSPFSPNYASSSSSSSSSSRNGGSDDGSIYILIYVHTSPSNYRRREVIRRTWGNCVQYSRDVSVRIVFLMGVQPDLDEAKAKHLNDSLRLEQDLYGDLVQEDFIDTYHNLTYKGVAALKWISLFCPNARFILKTDDDIFVNMYSLIRYFKHLEKDESNLKGLIMCAVWYGMPVLRTGKWKVLKEDWAGDWYPTYCSGSAFIMSTDVAMILHEVSYHVPFFWVDDFYITGLLPLKAGNIAHRQFGSAYVLNGDLLEEYFTGPQWQSYIFSHLKELDRILLVWKKMTKLAKREAVAEIKKVLPGQLPS